MKAVHALVSLLWRRFFLAIVLSLALLFYIKIRAEPIQEINKMLLSYYSVFCNLLIRS